MINLKIKDKKNCTGCYACFNICPVNCISMESDEEGFEYPRIETNKCIKCGKCVDICPILNSIDVDNNPVAYACINEDESIRLESSSGGIFSLIAEKVIKNDGLVFGAEFNKNFEVEHNFVESENGLGKFRGSKYVQSKIGDTYKKAEKFLLSGRLVLFTGTPCQIAGLKSYLGHSYDNLLCLDIICHGVPSPEVWKKYIEYREEKAGSKTQRIAFRRKDEGWKRYSVSFLFKNDTEYRKTLDKDLYMRAFLKNVCLRPSCYDCKFKTIHRQSDITLADFWGIGNLFPEMDDDKGTSLILVNSNAGKILFEQIKEKTLFKKVDVNKAILYNSSAVRSVKYNPNREKFLRDKDIATFGCLVKKYCRDSLGYKIKLTIRIGLKKMGLLDVAKKFLKRG